jgi:hypothetical protein
MRLSLLLAPMSAVHANCPSCGGQVNFRVSSSFVTICEFCSSAVARSDRGLEDRGKVVDLIDSQSPLDLWIAGHYGESRFEIVGRTQIKHSMGGVWDEWYCAFDSGHWGWLAEAQGRFYMSFSTPFASAPPPFASLAPGQSLSGLTQEPLVVAELGQAEILGAKGEIPYLLEPGGRYHYADLSGTGGVFATLDYSDAAPELYLGKEVTLAEMGISVSAPAREEPGKQISAHALECPNCRGSLELVAPGRCERVACPYCGALSDVNQGKLNVLQLLDKERFPDPPLPLGSKGVLEGHEMVICGYMVRSTTWEGEFFYWDEYLLYHPQVGFRWLTDSDGHWSYVEPLPAADVKRGHSAATHEGRSYRCFDAVASQVEFVLGQFYWNVAIGERVHMADYTSPPYSLSEEQTETELNWSRSTYMPKKDVEDTFGIKLREPTSGTVGLNQPYPQAGIYKAFMALLVLGVVAFALGSVRNRGKAVLEETFTFEETTVSESQVQFSQPLKLAGRRNIEIEAFASVSNSWVYLQFDLINEKSGAVTFFDLPIEFYSGPDWTEGSSTSKKVLKSVGEGTYTLRVGSERKDYHLPMRVRVTVREGVMRLRYLLVLLGFLFMLPLFTFLHHRSFEQRRWSDASEDGPFWAQETES